MRYFGYILLASGPIQSRKQYCSEYPASKQSDDPHQSSAVSTQGGSQIQGGDRHQSSAVPQGGSHIHPRLYQG